MRQTLASAAWALGSIARGDDALERYEYRAVVMGVEARVLVYTPDEADAIAASRVAFDRLDRLDAVLSDYRVDSELAMLLELPGPMPVSADMARALTAALDVAGRTGGAFDPTVGPLVSLWRESRSTLELPAPDRLEAARALVGWRRIHWDPASSVVAIEPGARLDFGGIGKGLAAHAGIEALRAAGVPRAMVALAGDIAVGDPPPGMPGWRIVIETSPQDGPDGEILLANRCVSTSGDAEQYLEIDGERYSHIVDPRSGLGLREPIAAAVVSVDGAIADALATGLCVAGFDAAPEVLSKFPGCAAIVEAATPAGRRRQELEWQWEFGVEPPRSLEQAGSPGFVPIFDGQGLGGWQGVVTSRERSRLGATASRRAQERADAAVAVVWAVEPGGVLACRPRGPDIRSWDEYGNFELVFEYWLPPGGQSGVYVRGVPQVHFTTDPDGSGGLLNNQRSPSMPMLAADHAPKSWNAARIRVEGDRVSVWINGLLVTDRIVLENYLDRMAPLPRRGPIVLQGSKLGAKFREIAVRQLPE